MRWRPDEWPEAMAALKAAGANSTPQLTGATLLAFHASRLLQPIPLLNYIVHDVPAYGVKQLTAGSRLPADAAPIGLAMLNLPYGPALFGQKQPALISSAINCLTRLMLSIS
jgi:hypothetical protein